MGLKKSKGKIALAEKNELLALHPELKNLQKKIDRAFKSAGLDRTRRLDFVRKVILAEQTTFDLESQNAMKLIELLRPSTDIYSFDPALKLVALNLLEESQKNSKINAQMLTFLKGYLEYCQQHEKVSN